jgi:arylsulfatase A-like enzyme
LPTLLAAAGTKPDAAYPSDGENLLPVLTMGAAPRSRKLYWRYKTPGQRAMRDGDWKYLSIAGNEFLFNVVKDPRERANLRARQPEIFARLKSEWDTWNSTMLPEKTEPTLLQNPARFVPDRYSVPQK